MQRQERLQQRRNSGEGLLVAVAIKNLERTGAIVNSPMHRGTADAPTRFGQEDDMKQFWRTITRSIQTFKAKGYAKAFNIKRSVTTLDTTVISVKDARVNCGFFSCFITCRRRWRDRCGVHAGTLSSSPGAVCRTLHVPVFGALHPLALHLVSRVAADLLPSVCGPVSPSPVPRRFWFLWQGPVVLLSVCCWNLRPSATGRSRRTVSGCGIARRSRRCSWSRTTQPGERILYLSTQMSL